MADYCRKRFNPASISRDSGKGDAAYKKRWQNVHDGNVYFPYLNNDDADSWNRNLNRVDNDWRSDYRLCFLCAWCDFR
jgi:hypothetical protein